MCGGWKNKHLVFNHTWRDKLRDVYTYLLWSGELPWWTLAPQRVNGCVGPFLHNFSPIPQPKGHVTKQSNITHTHTHTTHKHNAQLHPVKLIYITTLHSWQWGKHWKDFLPPNSQRWTLLPGIFVMIKDNGTNLSPSLPPLPTLQCNKLGLSFMASSLGPFTRFQMSWSSMSL